MSHTQPPPWLVNKISFHSEGETHTGNDSKRKQHFTTQRKTSYTNGSKSTGKKVGCTAVFTGITRRGLLSEEASIRTAEMTAMKEIKEREQIRWVIYTNLLCSMLAIKNNRENHPIFNILYKKQNSNRDKKKYS